MRAHPRGRSSPVRSHTEQHVVMLNSLAQKLVGELGITEPGDKNDVLARVLALDAIGKTPPEITKLVVRLHARGTPPGRWERKPKAT